MVTISIGGMERNAADADASWVTQNVNGPRHDGLPVCVSVAISTGGMNMRLATPDCSTAPGATRRPNAREQLVFDLWRRLHLGDPDFTAGNVIAFLRQMDQLL